MLESFLLTRTQAGKDTAETVGPEQCSRRELSSRRVHRRETPTVLFVVVWHSSDGHLVNGYCAHVSLETADLIGGEGSLILQTRNPRQINHQSEV